MNTRRARARRGRSNIERPTSNVEFLVPTLLSGELRFLLQVSKQLKEATPLAWLTVRYWVFVFLFDVGMI